MCAPHTSHHHSARAKPRYCETCAALGGRRSYTQTRNNAKPICAYFCGGGALIVKVVYIASPLRGSIERIKKKSRRCELQSGWRVSARGVTRVRIERRRRPTVTLIPVPMYCDLTTTSTTLLNTESRYCSKTVSRVCVASLNRTIGCQPRTQPTIAFIQSNTQWQQPRRVSSSEIGRAS